MNTNRTRKIPAKMDISFIIVNYGSAKFLKPCLTSLTKNAPSAPWEAIIVNNDSEPLEDFFYLGNIRVIENGNNDGFAKACNLGSNIAKGRILFFLNPDTEVRTSNIDLLVEKLNDPSVGIAAPKLLLPSGDIQPWSNGKRITPFSIILGNLFKIDDLHEIDWASGAALAITKDLFMKIGGFDEVFFMYFEDVDLCKRVSRSGKRIVLVPEVEVVHIGGQSSNDQKKQKDIYYKSQDYYLKKYFGPISTVLLKILRSMVLFFKK